MAKNWFDNGLSYHFILFANNNSSKKSKIDQLFWAFNKNENGLLESCIIKSLGFTMDGFVDIKGRSILRSKTFFPCQ